MNPDKLADRASPSRLRRSLLLGAAGATLAQAGGCGGGFGGMGMSGATPAALVDPYAAGAAEQDLPIMALDDGLVDATGRRTFALVAQRGTTPFRSGVLTPTMGYNGALLGPALHLRSGEKTTIRVSNQLGEVTTVHWHGLILPASEDGGPHQTIAPGAQWTACFTVANPASTCWFHPHGHGSTGRQVASGLAGLLIVDDPATNATLLPHTWGVDDVAIVLQDKRFTAAGQIDYTLSATDLQMGYAGHTLLANGTVAAVWRAPQQWLRLRLLNGCNARTLVLRWGNATPLLQVANEGGFLARPLVRTTVTLAPGERAEILLDCGGVAIGQDITLHASSAMDSSGMGMGMGMGGGMSVSEVIALKIRVALPRQPGAVSAAPAGLAAAPPVVAGAGARVRSFSLDGGMMGSPFAINGRRFDIQRVDFAAPAGTVETWRFVNATGMAHPMHVHGVRMTLLSRDGAAPAPHEQGLRDTFLVDAMQTISVAVQLPALAAPVPLMFHCHILEHEDAGMMGQFITV